MQSTEVYLIPTHSGWITLTWSELFEKLGHTQRSSRYIQPNQMIQMVQWLLPAPLTLVSQFPTACGDATLGVQLPRDSSRPPQGGHQDAWMPRSESRRSAGPWQTCRAASLPFQGRTPPAWHSPAEIKRIQKSDSKLSIDAKAQSQWLRMGDLAISHAHIRCIPPWLMRHGVFCQ